MKRLLLILVALAASSCVQPAQIDVIEREQRRMRSEMANMHTELEGIRTNVADTRANLQPMQRDLNAVKERIEEARVQVGKQIGQSNLQGDQRVKSLEARIGKLEDESKLQADMIKSRDEEIKKLKDALQDAQKTSANVAPADGMAEMLQGETDAVRREYEAAWLAFDKKDYKLALSRFRDFLKRNPKSKLAANAQYWLAESHYSLREFDQAIIEFDAVRRRYPQSEKAPAALLKQGFAFAELGEKLNARLVLQEVVDKYPQAPEAARARQRLKTLES